MCYVNMYVVCTCTLIVVQYTHSHAFIRTLCTCMQCSRQNFEKGGCKKHLQKNSKIKIIKMTHNRLITKCSTSETIALHTIAVYLHLYNCLVMITIKYRLALHVCHHSCGGYSSL